MTERTISPADFRRLRSLLKLAGSLRETLEHVFDAVRDITGEPDDNGHTADAVYNGTLSAVKLLAVLGIPLPNSRR